MRYIVREKTDFAGAIFDAFDTLEKVRVQLANGAYATTEKAEAEAKVAAMNAPSRPTEAKISGVSFVIRSAEAIALSLSRDRTFPTRNEALDFADKNGIEHSRIKEIFTSPIDLKNY